MTSKSELTYKRALALYEKVQDYDIRIDNSVARWITDKRYDMLYVQNDYKAINAAIEYANVRNELNDIPPPIIPIKGTTGALPLVYFVKSNLPTELPKYRKKKTTKPKTKRRSK